MHTPHHVSEPDATPAQNMLKRAYLQMSLGYLEEALISCKSATEHAPQHFLPPTLEGAVLIAAGRAGDAIKHLSKVTRKFPSEILPQLYFCEALLLGGRFKRGRRELDKICTDRLQESPWAEFGESLRQTWCDLDETMIPAPLVVATDIEEVPESSTSGS